MSVLTGLQGVLGQQLTSGAPQSSNMWEKLRELAKQNAEKAIDSKSEKAAASEAQPTEEAAPELPRMDVKEVKAAEMNPFGSIQSSSMGGDDYLAKIEALKKIMGV